MGMFVLVCERLASRMRACGGVMVAVGASALIVLLSPSLWSYDAMRWHCASISATFILKKRAQSGEMKCSLLNLT